MPAFSMMVRKPEPGEPGVASSIRDSVSSYTLSTRDIYFTETPNQKKVPDFRDRAAELDNDERDAGEEVKQ